MLTLGAVPPPPAARGARPTLDEITALLRGANEYHLAGRVRDAEPQQVQRVGVPGLGGQNRAVAELGVGEPAGLMVADAFLEPCGGGRGAAGRGGLGSHAGGKGKRRTARNRSAPAPQAIALQ